MGMLSKLARGIREQWKLIAALEDVAGHLRGLKGSFWLSWGDLSPGQLQELRASGCSEIIVNTNDTKRSKANPFQWVGGDRAKVMRRCEMALKHDFTLGAMPWFFCDPEWAAIAGDEMARMHSDLSGGLRLVQPDWEGTSEVTARIGAKVHTRKAEAKLTAAERARIAAYVGKVLQAFAAKLPPSVVLGITTLYFRRVAGDAAIMWNWTDPITGKHWTIDELAIQAYSVWDTSNPATMLDNYAPYTLQLRAMEFYRALDAFLTEIGIGINGWKLTRPHMTAEAAMDGGVEGVIASGAKRLLIWGGHLMDDEGIRYEADRFDLALAAYERACKDGARVDPVRRTTDPYADPDDDVVIHWDHAYVDESIARGGGPDGYALPGQVNMKHLVSAFRPAVIRFKQQCDAERRPWGTVVPITKNTRQGKIVYQYHPWTNDPKTGKRIPHKGPGGTLFFKRAA